MLTNVELCLRLNARKLLCSEPESRPDDTLGCVSPCILQLVGPVAKNS